MKFDVQLDREQIQQIASTTADKVLETVKYVQRNEEWDKQKIEDLENRIKQRDSMIVQRDLHIDRLREYIKKLESQLEQIGNSTQLKGNDIK